MLKIPLSAHGSPNLEITVEAEEEYRSTVRLLLELGPNELVSEHGLEPTGRLEELLSEYPSARVDANVVDDADRDRYVLADEVRRLLHKLRGVRDERSLWRELDPMEARELAAALVHHATEVERVFR